MADSRWSWIRAHLVALVCAVVVVPAVVATAVDEDVDRHAARAVPRLRPVEPPARSTSTPTTTTLAPAPTPTEPPEEPLPPEPPPATAAPRAVDPPAAPAPPPEPETATATGCGGGDAVGMHNAERCQHGVGGLVYDGGLSANAQTAANRLLGAGSCEAMTHSDLAGVYAGRSWGENLGCVNSNAGCTGSVASLMASWMASPSHAANVLNPSFARIGYASACDGHNNYFVVHFTS